MQSEDLTMTHELAANRPTALLRFWMGMWAESEKEGREEAVAPTGAGRV